MARDYLVKSFFRNSYFESKNGKKTWVSKQSLLTGFVSSFAGAIFIIFLYLTVGAAMTLAYNLLEPKLNMLFFVFTIAFVFLLTFAAFAFFKDLFSSVRINVSGASFEIETPITLRKYLNLFFLREKHSISSYLKSISYSRIYLDFFSSNADFFYNVYFVFQDGSEVKFPQIYTTSDILSYFLDDISSVSKARFGYFTRDEVKKIAGFFGVPSSYRD